MAFSAQANTRQDAAPRFGAPGPAVGRAEFSFGGRGTSASILSTSTGFSFVSGATNTAAGPAATSSIGWGVVGPSNASSANANPFGRVSSTAISFAETGAGGSAASWQSLGPSSRNSGFGQLSARSNDANPFGRGTSSSAPFVWPSSTLSTRDSPFNSVPTTLLAPSPGRWEFASVDRVMPVSQGGSGFRFGPNSATAGLATTTVPGCTCPVHNSSFATQHPSRNPFAKPTAGPFAKPTADPLAVPNMSPSVWTANPFVKPNSSPFAKPTANPFMAPTSSPLAPSTSNPFAVPSSSPLTTATANPFVPPTDLTASGPSFKSFVTPTPTQTSPRVVPVGGWADLPLGCNVEKLERKLLARSQKSTSQKPCFCWPGSDLTSNGHQPKTASLGSTWSSKSTVTSSAAPSLGFQFRSLGTFPSPKTGTTCTFEWSTSVTTASTTTTVTAAPPTSAADPFVAPNPVSTSPEPLVAAPDVNPYGVGSFGDGLVEEKVKTVLSSSASRSSTRLFDRPSPRRAVSGEHYRPPSARLAGRVGLPSTPLQLRPTKKTQPRFPCPRPRRTAPQPSSSAPSARIVDSFRFSSSFSRLAVSKRALRIQQSMEIEARSDPEVDLDAGTKSPSRSSDHATKSSLAAVSLSDDEDVDTSRDSKPTSNCPELLHDEYFTVPPMRELQQFSDEELARVEDFTIGRRDCGQIVFRGATDVRGLKLDAIVVFSRGEVVVYPDDDAKPDVGRGLNKRADVQLRGVFPGEHEAQRGFSNRLETHTKALGAEFLGYEEGDAERESGGVWRFSVENF